MKKFLSWISFCMIALASIFVLASCGDKEPSAEALLNGLIVEQENTVVSGDFSVAATVAKGETKYNLTWTSDNSHFVVAQEAANDAYVISVTRPDAEKQTAMLTASLAISKNNKATKSFKVSVLPYDVYDFSSEFKFAQNGANVCGEFALPTSYTLEGTAKTCTISWVSADESLIKVAADGKSATAILSFEKIETKMKATFTYNGESTTKSYTVNVLQQTIYPVETELKENTPYVFGLIQKTLENNYYYFKGTMSGSYGAMSKDVNDAIDMYVEATEGGYYIYFMEGTAKKYFNGYNDVSKYIKLEDTPETVWKWDTEYNTFVQTYNGSDYYFGTYSSYETLSISEYSAYIKTSFPVQVYVRQTILDSAPVFADELIVDFEAKQFTIENQVAGEVTLQANGKKFDQVAISYEVVEGYEELVTITEGVATFAEISKNAEVKLNVTLSCGEYEVTKEVAFTLLATVDYAKSLVEGMPYVFALVQGKLENKTLYFKGVMNGYYGALTENAEEAVAMYVEAVEGGYNLYFYNAEGVKTYVTLVVEVKDGKTYTNFTLAAQPSTVWTWNEDLFTLVTVINEKTYYLGTSGTYSTLSASTIDKAPTSFVAHFFDKTVKSFAEALKAPKNTKVELTGVVVAVEVDEFILSDGTNNIHVNMYGKGFALPELGATVVVKGTRDVRNYGPNVIPTEAPTTTEAMTITTPNATVYDAAGLDALVAGAKENGITVSLISFTGTLAVDGKYYNVNVEGATTAIGSLALSASLTDAVKALDGKEIVVTGYLYQSASNKYVNVIVTSVVEKN